MRGDEQDLMQGLPTEVKKQVLRLLSLEDYISALQAFKGTSKSIRLPLETELEMLRKEFSSELATSLVSTRVNDILAARGTSTEGGAEKVAPGQILKELVDGIYKVPAEGKIRSWMRVVMPSLQIKD